MGSADNTYELIVETLRKKGPVHTPRNQPVALFERLGLPLPERPAVAVQTLVSTGEIMVDQVDDDVTEDPRTPSGRFCDRYMAR